jgi:myo-inositol-1-phosphate synthase
MLVEKFKVESPNVHYEEDAIVSSYDYQSTSVERSSDGKWTVKPTTSRYEFRTETKVPKLG